MKKSSEAIQISSSISETKLNEILEDMIMSVESNLWINVEDGHEENSFWISFEEKDSDEYWPTYGIIEINVNDDVFNKILSLAHEVGHYFLEKDKELGNGCHKMFEESVAWYLGYRYFESNGFSINAEEYRREMNKCLEEYTRSINEKNNN